MKELKVISLENGVILSENLVKGSILPRTSAELERDVLIQNDTIVEGGVSNYTNMFSIQLKVPSSGIEPETRGFSVLCSTN